MFFTLNKVTKLYQTLSSEKWDAGELKNEIKTKNLIAPHKDSSQPGSHKGYNNSELPYLGKHIGFLPDLEKSKVMSVFVTKGGVLKTSLTLNIARMAALHGVKTLVIGLDLQGDISTALGYQRDIDGDSFESAVEKIDSTQGLADVFMKRCDLEDVIVGTDLPTLDLIPETPELVALEQSLIHKAKRESWLKENVISPLREQYDLFIIDCY